MAPQHYLYRGNWVNSGTFNSGTSTVIFPVASGNQTITNSSGETFYNLTINKASGDLQLINNIIVNNSLTLTSGDLDLNGNIITLDANATLSETPGNTVKGTSGKITITKNIGTPSGDNVGGLGAMISSTIDMGVTTVERYPSAAHGEGNTGILRQFDIAPSVNSSLNATLRFYYDDSELNGITENTLVPFKSLDGSDDSWTLVSGSTFNATDNYVELSGINDLSYWTLASSVAPLPVEMVSFYGASQGSIVELTWSTETEVNNYGFEVQRRIDSRQLAGGQQSAVSGLRSEWKTVGFIKGSGNSNSPKNYSFVDKNPVGGGKFIYRLKKIDLDGKYTYSDEINVEVAPGNYSLYQNYPNPFNPATTIKYAIPVQAYVRLTIYNSIGEKIITLVNEQKQAGYYEVEFISHGLSSGVYFYTLTAGSYTSTKKLILMR